MVKYKIDLKVANYWSELPNPWKKVKNVKPLNISFNKLEEDSFIKLFEPFFSTDALRIAQCALLVDKDCFVATESHILITVPKKANSNIEQGTYIISPYIAKKVKEKVGKINEKFPDYKVVIHYKTEFTCKINALKLKTYCEAMQRGQYVNNVTNIIKFEINSQKITLNSKLLLNAITAFMQLGHEDIYVGFIAYNRALIFTDSKESATYPKDNIGKSTIVLIMPSIEASDIDAKDYGASDIDWGSESTIYFSFTNNEIYNSQDGSTGVFDRYINSNTLPYTTEKNIQLLKRLAGKNKKIPILDYIKVKDGIGIATTFKETIAVKGVDVQDGIYEIVSDGLKNTTYDMDDFPSTEKYTNPSNFYSDITEFEVSELNRIVEEAKNFVSDDDLRPALTGITFNSKDDSKVKVYSSNAHILYANSLDSNTSITINNSILYPENIKYYLGSIESNFVKLKQGQKNSDEYMFESSDLNIRYATLDSSATPPKFNVVFPQKTDRRLTLNKTKILEFINKIPKSDLKEDKCFIFDFIRANFFDISGIQNATLYLGYFDKTNLELIPEREIGKIEFEITTQYHTDWGDKDCSLIMPIKSNDNKIVAFNPSYLKTVLSVDQEEGYLYFNSNKLGLFLVSLRQISAVTKPLQAQQTQPKTQSKEDIEKIIKGLQVLAKMGNTVAQTKIKAYTIILKRK